MERAMPQKKAFRLPLRNASSRNRGLQAEEEHTGVDPRVATGEAMEVAAGTKEEEPTERWSRILPEILSEIVRRVESSDGGWPLRKSVVSCACVCRRWREVTTGVVGPPGETGKITFPNSLKQPGPSDLPIQCYIKRNKNNSTFYLYLSLSQTFVDKGKFLLAAQRFRRGAHINYIISLNADDLSQGSNAYVGNLRSDFLGTKFKIYDSRAPSNGAKVPTHPASRRFANKQISPQVPASNFEIGQVHYKFNLLKTKGPRRMSCTMQCNTRVDDGEADSVVLKNKAPRWHEHLQCWCLNFHGRVTIASVKNFQLVAASGTHRTLGVDDNEPALLQFGKVGDDMFTMDYREPLSAFQAFAICLTSFGTKFACE